MSLLFRFVMKLSKYVILYIFLEFTIPITGRFLSNIFLYSVSSM